MNMALFARHTVDELVCQLLRVAIEVLNADVGSVQLYDQETDSLVFTYVQDPRATQLLGQSTSLSQGIAGKVFREGQGCITRNASESPEWNSSVDELTGYQTDSLLSAPIRRKDATPIGVVQILNGRRDFDEFDLDVLEVLCGYAAVTIETARLAEEARQAQLVRLIGDVSHDIGNMMTPIQSGLMTLEDTLNETWELLGEIRSESAVNAIEAAKTETKWVIPAGLASCEQIRARTLQITNAIKGMPTVLRLERVSLNEIVREVGQILGMVAEAEMVRLSLDMELDLDPIEADRLQLYNAVYNLVNNALPETPPGGKVTVRTRKPSEDEGGNGWVVLEVEDSGRGMPEKVRASLFTDETLSTKRGGTGLGTKIVANVVRQHSGRISVWSEEGQGTRFMVWLPVDQPITNGS